MIWFMSNISRYSRYVLLQLQHYSAEFCFIDLPSLGFGSDEQRKGLQQHTKQNDLKFQLHSNPKTAGRTAIMSVFFNQVFKIVGEYFLGEGRRKKQKLIVVEHINQDNKFMDGQQLAPKAGHFLFTSENVTQGHPDKLCDYISDSVLDACLQKDPQAKVACESAVKNSICMVFGEISTTSDVNFQQIARQAIKDVGYDSNQIGMDYKTATIIVAIDKQSPEIAQSVHQNKKDEEIGAGDQGLMIGYATDETPNFMPLSHDLSSALVRRLEQCRKEKILNWIRPDGKVQVTVEYERKGHLIEPRRVHTVLISTQHNPDVTNQKIREDVLNEVIKVAIPEKLLVNTRYVINPSQKFVIGGPHGDAGLTGRKIIADTYGGWGGHGGGAFSGKDPTKVDRSAAYAARWISKNLVANGFCKRAMVQVAYSIGIAQPLSIHVDSYNTVIEGFSDEDLQGIIYRNFDLRPGMIIKNFDLRRPIYRKTASGGHFGRSEPDFKWETVIDLSHEKKK